MQPVSVVILAAGQGKRMVSDLPKVLHPLGGKPLLAHVLDTARCLQAAQCVVVYGHGGAALPNAFSTEHDLLWVEQAQQLGTGHALAQALPQLNRQGVTLVLYGDVPLIQAQTLRPLLAAAQHGALALLTVELPDPSGYGRIVRDAQGAVQCIVEEKDASTAQLAIREINTGILAVATAQLSAWLAQLTNNNAQGEYYLTDIIAMAVRAGVTVTPFSANSALEVQGVNERRQLADMERFYQAQQAQTLMRNGATLLDPSRVEVRGTLTHGRDVLIDVNVIFAGTVRLGQRVKIGAFCVIKDAIIGDDVEILSHSHIEGAEIGNAAHIGPFARLRPETKLAAGVHIGNFVETKKTTLGAGSKANHLTYLGDAEIGAAVNIGAGTITCNYDGANKHKTLIADGVFVGSNSSLVAPVQIGNGATIGAGSAISRTVSAGSLCVTRAPRKEIANWQRPTKSKT